MLGIRSGHFTSISLTLSALVLSLVAFQQCSNVKLEEYQQYSFKSARISSPLRLDPPSDYLPQRRYVILVDMSNSMLSSSCPQDVDGGMLFENTQPYYVWDPNKRVGNPADHRGSGVDCRINKDLAIARSSILFTPPNILGNPPTFFEVPFGVDHENDRVTIIKKWVTGVIESASPEVLTSTKILLLPVTGGNSQKLMMDSFPISPGFVGLTDPKLNQAIQFLVDEHDRHKEILQSTNMYRYQNTRMGTTSPGELIRRAFDSMKTDMRALYNEGQLTFGEYEFIYLSDGKITPLPEHIQKTLSAFHQCTSCAMNYKSCAGTCSALVSKMELAWGIPTQNTDEALDFNIGLIQSLPNYFGAGRVRINFVQLKKDRFLALNPGESSKLERLVTMSEGRGAKATLWQAPDDKPPYYPPGSQKGATSFKVTNIFILNPNSRLNEKGEMMTDSDSDGLFDADEIKIGTDPGLSRTNGHCLDGFLGNQSFRERCDAFAKSQSCDATLDSDGDSLNECEENLLGTNPFDFDSDGDSIPDFYEWLYGYNPLVSDSKLDTNGDGYPNLIPFSFGIGPIPFFESIAQKLKPDYRINAMGREEITDRVFGKIFVDLQKVTLNYIPLARTVSAPDLAQTALYSARGSVDPSLQQKQLIPNNSRLIAVSGREGGNAVVALARMIDVDDPRRAYWRIKKWDIYVNSEIVDPMVDLSEFQQVRAMDEN